MKFGSATKDLQKVLENLTVHRSLQAGDAKQVSFVMLTSNLSTVQQDLDRVRAEPPKFLCLNDNFNDSLPNFQQQAVCESLSQSCLAFHFAYVSASGYQRARGVWRHSRSQRLDILQVLQLRHMQRNLYCQSPALPAPGWCGASAHMTRWQVQGADCFAASIWAAYHDCLVCCGLRRALLHELCSCTLGR